MDPQGHPQAAARDASGVAPDGQNPAIQAAAPPVVAVVVTRDPGPWFEETLRALEAQDYPNLSVLVIDAGSDEDPTPVIARVLPGAYVRRVDANPGYGTAANQVLEVVEGAAFFAFVHDDAVADPGSVRVMVEEAFRSNAGIVGPKLVSWTRPHELLQVGMSIDKTGVPAAYVERGELDQEQHDAVRDVFFVPGACTLVRSDLFAELGGFDAGIDFLGDDLDLCWRAHVAGARVMVAPEARVRHLEALGERRPVDDRRRLQARHRLRTTLKCYGPFHLVRVLPQAVLFAFVETLYALAVGRTAQARDVVGAWVWNGRRVGEVWRGRRQVHHFRRVRDSEVRRFQVRGSARLSAFLRGQIGGGEDRLRTVTAAGRELAGSLREGEGRTTALAWMLVVFVLIIGSRHLLTGEVPSVGEMATFPGGPSDVWSEFVSGWRTAGLGSESPAPTGLALLGLASALTAGAMGLLRTLLVVGMLPLGLFGMWRLARRLGSARASAVALIVYAAIPLPYDSLATGRWSGLVMYGLTPWLVRVLASAGGADPFTPAPGRPRPAWRHAVVIGLITALAVAVVPFAIVLVPLLGVGLFVGSLLTGAPRPAVRMLVTSVAGAGVAVLLHFPWSLDFLLPGSEWASFGGIRTLDGAGLPLDHVLRFETGPLGAGPVGWGFLIAAALPLLIGGGWRFGWAVSAWAVALGSFGLAWVGERGWFPPGLPAVEVLLGPAAVGVALAAGLGVVAFETDLRGYRFGWRQLASVAAGAAVVVSLGPLLIGATNGRWHAPSGDFDNLLGFMPQQAGDGAFRVLWIGDPRVLPLSGWRLADGLAYGTSENGPPDIRGHWSGSADGSTGLIADALTLAAGGETGRLGRLLAPMGIRYIVVPDRAAPARHDLPRRPVPEVLLGTLASQLDLEGLEVDEALTLYENTAWAPVRALLPDDAAPRVDEGGLVAVAEVDVSGADPVLRHERAYARYGGRVNEPGEVYFAAASADGWRLEVDGERADRHKAFGWANAFTVDGSGAASLAYRTSPLRYGVIAVQAGIWFLAVRALLLGRYRRSES